MRPGTNLPHPELEEPVATACRAWFDRFGLDEPLSLVRLIGKLGKRRCPNFAMLREFLQARSDEYVIIGQAVAVVMSLHQPPSSAPAQPLSGTAPQPAPQPAPGVSGGWCNVCNVPVQDTPHHLSVHLAGARHKKEAAAAAAAAAAAGVGGQQQPALVSGLRCLLCNATTTSESQLSAHLAGARHMRALAALRRQQPAPGPSQQGYGAAQAHASPPPAAFTCAICNVRFRSEDKLLEHLASARHLANAAAAAAEHDFQQRQSPPPPAAAKRRCGLCRVTLPSADAFAAHLQSAQHR